jgi:hypothetical protein
MPQPTGTIRAMKALRPSARSRLLAATLLTAVGALAGCGGVSSAAPQPPPHRFADVPSGDGQPLLPPPAGTTVGFGERVHAELGDFPEFGDTAVNRDRTRFTIRWHGEVPAVLREIVDDYAPHAPFDIVIEDTEFLPGDLRAEAGRLLREHSPVVQGAGPRPAGDGVDVTLSPEAVRVAGSAEAALTDNGVVSDFPLFVIAVGEVEPA